MLQNLRLVSRLAVDEAPFFRWM